MGEKKQDDKKNLKPKAGSDKPIATSSVVVEEPVVEKGKKAKSGGAPSEKHGSFVGEHSCKNPGQDALHGNGRRVFNNSAKGPRCTVCKGLK